eukprot:8101757-Alexandrium_andersonii.AAC.1
MSASLVGSEMCIRDRDHGGLFPSCPVQSARTRAKQQRCVHEAGAHVSVCLLYTSDAADDM